MSVGTTMSSQPVSVKTTTAPTQSMVSIARRQHLQDIVFHRVTQGLSLVVLAALLAIIGMSLLLVWRHQANISKLLAGTESKLGQKTPVQPLGALPIKAKPNAPHGHAHHPRHKKGHH